MSSSMEMRRRKTRSRVERIRLEIDDNVAVRSDHSRSRASDQIMVEMSGNWVLEVPLRPPKT